ncbi:hypothetical protein [Azospirillum endophyticum]
MGGRSRRPYEPTATLRCCMLHKRPTGVQAGYQEWRAGDVAQHDHRIVTLTEGLTGEDEPAYK